MGHVFAATSRSARALGPCRKQWPCHPLPLFMAVSQIPNTRYVTIEYIFQAALVAHATWGAMLEPARSVLGPKYIWLTAGAPRLSQADSVYLLKMVDIRDVPTYSSTSRDCSLSLCSDFVLDRNESVLEAERSRKLVNYTSVRKKREANLDGVKALPYVTCICCVMPSSLPSHPFSSVCVVYTMDDMLLVTFRCKWYMMIVYQGSLVPLHCVYRYCGARIIFFSSMVTTGG